MANTLKTLSAGDITRKALQIYENNLVFCKNINREYDGRFAQTGAKNGGTLLIRDANEFSVRTGAVMDTVNVTESTQTLTLATQLGIDMEFSSAELTLSIDDFSKRFLEPAMARLAAETEKTVLTACYKEVYNLENTTFGTHPVLADLVAARATMQQGLAPDDGNRIYLGSALAMNSLITDSKGLYQPASAISTQYEKGHMGSVYSFKCMESEMTPVHTTGTRTTAGTCNLSGTANGDTHLAVTGTNGEIYLKGDIITVAGVYEVNQETKVAYTHLKQFVVGTSYTGTGSAADLTVAWPIYKSGPKQNCYCADWTAASAATVVDLGGSSGTASTAYLQNLAFHRDAFTFVMADLEVPKGQDFAYRANAKGMSIRLIRDYDVTNDQFPCRLDVIFGQKCTRPRWAVRVMS